MYHILTVTSVLRSIWWNNFISYCMYVLIVFEKNNFTEYANVRLCQMFSIRCCCKFFRRLRCWISEYIQLSL